MANKTGINPWLKMWTCPKATIRTIVDYNPDYRLFVLSAIYGFVSLISTSQSFALGLSINFFLLIFLCLIIAPLWGYLLFSISSFLIYTTGKWLKGKAKYKEVRACVAWSNVPIIANLVLWAILFGIFKQDILKDFPASFDVTPVQRAILFVVLLGQLILSIWIIVLYVNSLSEVQCYSVGKAILNIIFAVILFIGLFFVASFAYFLIMKGFNLA